MLTFFHFPFLNTAYDHTPDMIFVALIAIQTPVEFIPKTIPKVNANKTLITTQLTKVIWKGFLVYPAPCIVLDNIMDAAWNGSEIPIMIRNRVPILTTD